MKTLSTPETSRPSNTPKTLQLRYGLLANLTTQLLQKPYLQPRKLFLLVTMLLTMQLGYSQTYTFTSAGASGQFGPNQTQIDNEYQGTNLQGQVVSNNGIQQWIVPQSGYYRIESFGAQGGGSTTAPGGLGAHIAGEFTLNAGDTLHIVVGQTGYITATSSPSGNRGGGGGSFIWNPAQASQPLIVAGGGGGSNVSVSGATLGVDGATTTGGTLKADGTGSPGANGNGATPGGAGFFTNSSGENSGGPAFAALNGATGGDGYTASSHYGGFGGGGGGGGSPSTTYASGGGGGYSGGAGQGTPASQGGGGGGSYNAGLNQNNLAGVRSGDGLVEITILSTGATNDIGVVSVDEPTLFCSGSHAVVATIFNFGTNQVTTATVNWSVNGNLQVSVPFAGLLDTTGGSNPVSAQVTLGSFNFAPFTTYQVEVWTSMPNGMVDTTTGNDSLEVPLEPGAIDPSGLFQSNIAANSIDLGWTENGTASQWEISYGAPGFTAGSGTQLFTNSNPHALGGLTPNTDYDWYVRSVCSGGDTSNWVGPVSFTTLCASQLAGVYTINSALPTGGTNFNNFTDAVDELNECGVSGPVVFNVVPGSGPYTEQIELTTITGASAVNTITFNGNGNTLQFAPTSSARFIIRLNGSKHVTFSNLNVVSTDATYGWGVHLTNQADSNSIVNTTIDLSGVTSTGSSNVTGIVASGSSTSVTSTGDNANYLMVDGCEVIGGYYGIRLNGIAGTEAKGNVITNTTVRDFYAYGIYLYYQDGALIDGSDVNRENRTSVTTFYGITVATGSRNVVVNGNRVHDTHTNATSLTGTAYGLYTTGADAPMGQANVFSNNLVYNFNSASGTQYGIYNSGSDGAHYYYNTIVLDNTTSTGGTTRGVYQTSTATDLEFINNIFSITRGGSGTKHCLYFNTNTSSILSDHNVLYISATAGSNYTGRFDGLDQATLLDWQSAYSGIFDQNSVSADPIFANASIGALTPLSGLINNIGTSVGITVDFDGTLRSPTTPDPGAFEFTPVSSDLALLDGSLHNGECLSTNDTVRLWVQNIVSNPVDFSINALVADWSVTGPANSSGTITINTGTLSPQDTIILMDVGVDLSIPGDYQLNAYIQASAANLLAVNDTLVTVEFVVKPIISVSQDADTVYNPLDSVEINVSSPFLPGGAFFITEICHFKTGTGEPTGGWPAYLTADDYIEITGVPGSDLDGYTLEQWTGTTMAGSHIFTSGTVMGSNGTAIFAVGQLGSSTPSPADFYYHANGTYTGSFSSSTAAGRILKDPSGNIVDAVGYNGYTFPGTANVPTSEWINPLSGGTSSSGIRLEGPDVNSGTNWVLSASSPQDPNVVNANVPVPTPMGASNITWTLNGTMVDTIPRTKVGPFANPGTYEFVATIVNTPCGTLTDTVTIIADFAHNDLALIDFIPLHETCGQDSMEIQAIVYNAGALSQSNFGIVLDITGTITATFNYTYSGTLSGGYSDTVTLATINTTAGATLDLNAYSTLGIDERLHNDTISAAGVEIFGIPPQPTVPNQVFVCYEGEVMITADTSQYMVSWYTEATGGTRLDGGDTLTLSNVTSNDTVYAQASSGEQLIIGAPDPSIGSYGSWNSTAQWMNFTVHQATTIQSVEMYFSSAIGSSFSIVIRDAQTLNTVHTHNDVVAISNSTPLVPQEVPIQATLLPGDYQMNFGSPTGTFRNSAGGNYPYEAPGILSITGNTFSPSYYYMFYNWKVGGLGCPSTRVPVWVNLHPIPSVDLGSDTGICANVPVNLPLSANNLPGSTVNWSTGATGPSIMATSTGTYWAEETTVQGCSLRDSIIIEEYIVPMVDIGNDTAFCEDEFYLLGLNASWPNATYIWQDGSTAPFISVSSPGVYWVEVTSKDGCMETDTLVISEIPGPDADLGNDTIIDQGASITLDAGAGASYSWSTGATTQTISVDATGTYHVTVTAANGCVGADTITVTVRTGINDLSGIKALALFPNPTHTDAVLEIDPVHAGTLGISLTDLTGKQLYSEVVEVSPHLQQVVLPLSDLPAGMYLVKLTWDNIHIATLRVERIR